MKSFRPLAIFVLFLMVVSMACSAVTGTGGDTPAQNQPTEVKVSEPTDSPPPMEVSTEMPADQPDDVPPPTQAPTTSRFFLEEFESGFIEDNWEFFTLGTGEDTNLVIEQEDDHLLFDLGDKDLYVYYLYVADEYDDVSLKLNAENRGRNNNNVSIICRFDADAAEWYEFSVESGGLWYLYAFQDGYNRLDNGGTNALRQGKEVNEYGLICDGDKITLSVNGEILKTVTDNKYNLGGGLVGFNISFLNVLPITVEANWFEISEP